MIIRMCSTTRKEHEIFYSVIVRNIVNVMHHFCRKQRSPQVAFHPKPMLRNISFVIGMRMIRRLL